MPPRAQIGRSENKVADAQSHYYYAVRHIGQQDYHRQEAENMTLIHRKAHYYSVVSRWLKRTPTQHNIVRPTKQPTNSLKKTCQTQTPHTEHHFLQVDEDPYPKTSEMKTFN